MSKLAEIIYALDSYYLTPAALELKAYVKDLEEKVTKYEKAKADAPDLLNISDDSVGKLLHDKWFEFEGSKDTYQGSSFQPFWAKLGGWVKENIKEIYVGSPTATLDPEVLGQKMCEAYLGRAYPEFPAYVWKNNWIDAAKCAIKEIANSDKDEKIAELTKLVKQESERANEAESKLVERNIDLIELKCEVGSRKDWAKKVLGEIQNVGLLLGISNNDHEIQILSLAADRIKLLCENNDMLTKWFNDTGGAHYIKNYISLDTENNPDRIVSVAHPVETCPCKICAQKRFDIYGDPTPKVL